MTHTNIDIGGMRLDELGGPCSEGARLCLLSGEAVRKGNVQEPMRERPGSAVGSAGGLERRTLRLNRRGLNEAAIAAEVADVGFEVM
jgi:hypothetical protein